MHIRFLTNVLAGKTSRVGQNHIYTVYIRYFWQENHQIYGVYALSWPTLGIRHIAGGHREDGAIQTCMCLLFLNWCRECFAACVVYLFFSFLQCLSSTLSTLIGSWFKVKPATLLIPIGFFLVEECYIPVTKGSFSWINTGSGSDCLRSFFLFTHYPVCNLHIHPHTGERLWPAADHYC